MSTDNIDITDLVKQVDGERDTLATWSDARRKEFANTFDARTRAAKYLCLVTAETLVEEATRKQYISNKHLGQMFNGDHHFPVGQKAGLYDDHHGLVGGRPHQELDAVAQERAKDILQALPPLKQAVEVINPEIAKKIDRRDKILVLGQKYTDELTEISGPLYLSDFPEDMTLGAFREHTKDREKTRKKLLEKLNELGKEGLELDRVINKALYAGLPGLSAAVVKVISDHLERVTAFDQMNRRVGEKVMFGDSAAAMQILASFEKDEQVISTNIKAEFAGALEKLHLAAAPKKKTLKAKKEKK